MIHRFGKKKFLLVLVLLIAGLGISLLTGTFSAQVSYDDSMTEVEAGQSYQVDVGYQHSNALTGTYRDLLTSAVFTDASTFCPNRTEIVYLQVTNREAFPINFSLALKVTETGFGNTLSYAPLTGVDLLKDNKKNHPTSWESYLAAAQVSPMPLSKTVNDQLHTVSDRMLVLPGETIPLALAVHMDQNAGNEYQNKDLHMNFVVRIDANYAPGTIPND